MALTIRCVHCGRKVKRNPRIKKGQHYCGLAACQQARKNSWEQEKNKKDGHYRTRRRASKKRWLKEHPGSLYQGNYRATHPDYVQTNRENRLKKYHEKKLSDDQKNFVKTDASLPESRIPSGIYALFSYPTDAFGKTPEHFVKTDALIVQLTGIQQNTAHLFSNLI